MTPMPGYDMQDETKSERRVPISLHEFEAVAREALPRSVFDYYASGAHDELTLRRNRSAFDEFLLHYRVLVDVADPRMKTSMLGVPVSMPIGIAPTAFQRMAHPDGERATAKAAADHEVVMTLSTLSNTSLEDVTATSFGAKWFQLYVYKDREATLELVHRAECFGYKAIVFTVDAPYLGVRERDVRNEFTLPQGLTVANLTEAQMENLPEVQRESGLAAYFADLLEPALSWETLDWLVAATELPVVVKGIVRADDAARAVEHGASAILVSNHGGRQLDTAPATIEVLRSIVEAVDGRVEVYLDGGVRRGTDVVKALALGARGVFVGRPILWGLAHGGSDGVGRVLEILRSELRLAMALCGAGSLEEITRSLLDPSG